MPEQVTISDGVIARANAVRRDKPLEEFVEAAVEHLVKVIEREPASAFAASAIMTQVRASGPMTSSSVVDLLRNSGEWAHFAPGHGLVVGTLRDAYRELGGTFAGTGPDAIWAA